MNIFLNWIIDPVASDVNQHTGQSFDFTREDCYNDSQSQPLIAPHLKLGSILSKFNCLTSK